MNNEEKILAVLERMQEDISGLKQGQDDFNTRLGKVESDIDSIHRSVVKIEVEHGTRLGALEDGQKSIRDTLKNHTDRLERIENKVDELDTRVGVQDIQIKRIKTK